MTVSDLGLCVISLSKPISVVQLLKLCDLGAETPNLLPKHCEMIHTVRIASETASVANGFATSGLRSRPCQLIRGTHLDTEFDSFRASDNGFTLAKAE
jgi:hypothetical protein